MIVACGGQQGASPPALAPQQGDIPDVADKCPTIPTGCPGSIDEDGCPDLTLSLGAHCELSERDQRSFREVSDEMKKERRLSVISIVSPDAACATQLKKQLVDAGVNAARVESRITAAERMNRDVYFEVTAWDGKRCADGGSVTPR